MLIDPHLPNQRLMTMVLKLCHIESVDRVFFLVIYFPCIPIYACCKFFMLTFRGDDLSAQNTSNNPCLCSANTACLAYSQSFGHSWQWIFLCATCQPCVTPPSLCNYSLGCSRYNQLLEQSSRLTMGCILSMRSFTWHI